MPVVPLTDLRRRRRPARRGELVGVQTPQAFRAAELLAAYRAADEDGFEGTDTAALRGARTRDVPDRRRARRSPLNLKLTFPEDVALATELSPSVTSDGERLEQPHVVGRDDPARGRWRLDQLDRVRPAEPARRAAAKSEVGRPPTTATTDAGSTTGRRRRAARRGRGCSPTKPSSTTLTVSVTGRTPTTTTSSSTARRDALGDEGRRASSGTARRAGRTARRPRRSRPTPSRRRPRSPRRHPAPTRRRRPAPRRGSARTAASRGRSRPPSPGRAGWPARRSQHSSWRTHRMTSRSREWLPARETAGRNTGPRVNPGAS